MDVGCGDAFILGSLAAMFPSVQFHGVDSGLTPDVVSALSAHYSRPNLHLDQSLETISPRPQRPAALVLLMDVIEHVEDDQVLVRAIRSAECVDGETRWLVTVPAFQSLFSAHDVFLRHYRRYSRGTLSGSLERAGLRVVESGYLFVSLVPLRLLQVIKERIVGRPVTNATDTMTYGGLAAALLTRMLQFDAAITLGLGRAGIPVPGLSVCAVCRSA